MKKSKKIILCLQFIMQIINFYFINNVNNRKQRLLFVSSKKRKQIITSTTHERKEHSRYINKLEKKTKHYSL